MGCCESCFGKTDDEPSETSPLLGGSDGRNVLPVHPTDPVSAPSDCNGTSPAGSLGRSEQDKQSILTGIITQYNNEVIDITALESKIDAVEYMNRVQQYNRRVSSLTSGARYKQPALRSVTSNPASLLNAPPITVNDVNLISEVAGQLRSAMDYVKVQKQQELVHSLNHR